LGKARKLLEAASELKGLGRGKSVPTGTLRLGLTDASTQTIIPPAIMKFRERYPSVHLRLDVDDSKDIEEGVLRGHYDFGVITAGARPHPHLDTEEIYRDRIDALVSRRHPLAHRKRIGLAELAAQPLLVYPRRSRTRRIVDECFHRAGILPREIIDVYINTAAVRLAETGIGVALLSEAFIAEEIPKRRCVHLRIEGDPFSRTICVVRKQDADMSEAASAFYGMLKKKN
nr:LysR family transcriptional regulator substrate-binding protein [bacterium]